MNTFASRALLLASLLIASPALASSKSPGTPAVAAAIPRFADPDRESRARAALPEIDKVYADFATERHVPGLVWGVVLDGKLIHTGRVGFANLEKRIPAAADTRFRIASMTKSFTAMAILKLRDAGRLSLADRVDKFLPEFAAVQPLTTDAPPINIRHLLSMTAGFPEDNPWGDRQLAVGEKEFLDFLRRGLSLSNPAGVIVEYSNLGYALLGQIISRIAREPYQTYITREILMPLGMRDTRWEYAEVPADKLALGYRWENNAWKLEPMLHDGTYGAMGGLLTTLNDFARYVSFHLAAWPPRNDADAGPVSRGTLREMQRSAEINFLIANAKNWAGETSPTASAYYCGLVRTVDAKGVVSVNHSGGLPGFGSNFRFYPDHGFAVIAFANLTYAGTPNAKAAGMLLDRAKLPARTLPVSATLAVRQRELAELLTTWDPRLADAILAGNFFLDRSRDDWIRHARETLSMAGAIKSIGPLIAQNQLRGTFPMIGEKGQVDVFFTLTPEKTPRVQQVRLTFVKRKT